jgi:hypothetical protein
MEIGYEIWHVEGLKRARVLGMNNIKVELQEIGRRKLDLFQDRDRC